MQAVYGKQHIKNLELIIMDEHNTRMQATVRMALVNHFLMNTDVEICNDFTGSLHGFDFRSYSSITQLKQEENCQFDVIGHVVACEDLDNYDKNGKAGKKKPLTLVDAEGNELRCTLWSAFAQQFSDFFKYMHRSWKNCYGSSTCYDEDVGW
ncbi:replication protein A 70 kDa DNA-binding subunit B [Tanacetum coccineum]